MGIELKPQRLENELDAALDSDFIFIRLLDYFLDAWKKTKTAKRSPAYMSCRKFTAAPCLT